MVGRTNRGGMTRAGWLARMAAILLVLLPAGAQTRLTLEEAGARKPPDFTPAHAGERAVIKGVVSSPAFHFTGYHILAIEDGRYGGALRASAEDTSLNSWSPGDEIEVEGTISSLAGMVVMDPARVRLVRRTQPPAPVPLAVADLLTFRYLGRLVRTEGRVIEFDDTLGGPYMLISSRGESYRLFVPRGAGQPRVLFGGVKPGDKVQAEGVALQYSPHPPFNTRFELLVRSPAEVVRTERGWFIPPVVLASGTTVVLLVSFFLWSRERRLRHQRERMRSSFQIAEEILGAPSAETVLKRIAEALPRVLGVTRVQLYVHNRAARTLDAVGGAGAASISLSSPPDGTPAGAVACFHYRTLLVIPDTVRSPFPVASPKGAEAPESLLFVPMLAQGEVMGVLELDQDDRARDFSADEQALAQHLGNQIGVTLLLLEQRNVQEQLYRSEKLAAVGRLISGVVNELQAPLKFISEMAGRAESGVTPPPAHDLRAIAAEARKASGMVARLVSFAATEQVAAQPVDLGELLRHLVEFREGDWKASGVRVHDVTSREPVMVLGSHGQLEQVFLNLLVHAEQALADAPQKTITIRTSVLAKRLLVEISFTAPPGAATSEETGAVLGLARSIVTGHGGEVRLIEKANSDPHFEIELPVHSREPAAAPVSGAAGAAEPARRLMTALVIEDEEAVQRQLIGFLAARGCRVVPVPNADHGLELAHRMRFDVTLCSVHAPGLNWVELSERLQSRTGGFILLSDGYDPELSADFSGEGRAVVPQPIQEAELERALRSIETGANRHTAA